MSTLSWNNPDSSQAPVLAIAENGIRLGDQHIAKNDLFRFVAEPRSARLGLSYRRDGVRMETFTFASAEERGAALDALERELGMRRSTTPGSSGLAAAIKPALYLLVVILITAALQGALADASGGALADAGGRTAAKARVLVIIAQHLGPTGVWVAGGLLAAFFLLRTLMAWRGSGPKTVLEPAR